MRVGMIGLGRMGGNMARRLGRSGVSVCGFSQQATASAEFASDRSIEVANSIDDLLGSLQTPRVVWIMVPAGTATEETIQVLAQRLAPGDIAIDGGNAHYRDSQRRGHLLADKRIGFVDAGVSGGIWGLDEGYGLMLGGAHEHIDAILPLVHALAPAPDRGWVHCGPSGAGHFVKMVHNGIEYGLMQAYAEGFALLAARPDLELPLGNIAQAWCHGTVIRSWLLELIANVVRHEGSLSAVAAQVADSGEGRWTAQEAIDLGIPIPVINAALTTRFSSQGAGEFSARLLALLRNAFGGHKVPPGN